MAFQGAGRWDASVRVPLLDENSEVRRDVAARRKVALPDELEIFDLEEVHLLDAALPNLFLKPTRDFQMAQQRQDVAQQERPAGRVQQAEVELLDAAQMAQFPVLAVSQEQPPQEPLRVSSELALEWEDAHLLPKMRAQARKALQRDVPSGFPESQRVPQASRQQQARHLPALLKALLPVAQAWLRPQDAGPASSRRWPLPASPLRPQLPSPPALRNVFAQAPHVRGRANSSASFFP